MRKTIVFALSFSLFAGVAAKASPLNQAGYDEPSAFGWLVDGLSARFATGRCLRTY